MSNNQGQINVAYLGPEASFSHQAAIEVFQSQQKPEHQVSLHPLPSFSAIFSAVQNSRSGEQDETSYDYAVIPIENSTNGSVVQVLDLLAQCGLDSHALYPDLEVCAEYYLAVHHCLFVSPSSSSSSPDERHSHDQLRNAIRTLYTHPQVWGQCNRYLSQHFSAKLVERIDVGSTSAAAQLVARGGPNVPAASSAAISSRLAGQKHDLVCLAENIEDEPGQNTTRFFVVRNKTHTPRAAVDFASSSCPTDAENRSRRYKSLITFTIPHTKPGALADALAVFKKYGYNLTSIDTRPSRKRNWQYVFFVECEEASPSIPVTPTTTADEEKVADMLKELGKFTESLRYLGKFVDRLPNEFEDE